MGTGRTDEFHKDAVRIALTSGLSRCQVADDLGVGMFTMNKWVTAHRDTASARNWAGRAATCDFYLRSALGCRENSDDQNGQIRCGVATVWVCRH